jgi:ubiquinone/menaquinone biosynthesis C-methylase UbiE
MEENHLRLSLIGIFVFCAFAFSQAQTFKNDAEKMDRIARTIFQPIYPNLAVQIKEDFGITRRICVDIGGGSGNLAIELAKITDLEIYSLDIDPDATAIAEKNIDASHLKGTVKAVTADAQNMPFSDDFAHLVVSRASFIFWKDKVKGFKEALRILKPGGVAFIGTGFGNRLPPEDRERIQTILSEKNIGPPAELLLNMEEMTKILREAGIREFRLSTDEGCLCGLWVEFIKNHA